MLELALHHVEIAEPIATIYSYTANDLAKMVGTLTLTAGNTIGASFDFANDIRHAVAYLDGADDGETARIKLTDRAHLIVSSVEFVFPNYVPVEVLDTIDPDTGKRDDETMAKVLAEGIKEAERTAAAIGAVETVMAKEPDQP